MARKANPSKKIIEATLKLAGQRPWREISMADIAAAAKIEMAELTQIHPSKIAILDGFNRQIDDQVAAAFGTIDMEETIRDQLFDILMSRFDALQPYKLAIKSILRETVPYNPGASICGLHAVMRSMQASLNLLNIRPLSPIGCLKSKALAVIYLRGFKTWLQDDSTDMAKTMAAIDTGLAQAENLAQMLPRSNKYPQPKAA